MRTWSARRSWSWRVWVLVVALGPALGIEAPRAVAAASPPGASPPAASSPAAPLASARGAPQAQVAQAQVAIRVTRTELARPIPPGFLGLSLEFGSLYAYAGTDPRAINPVLVRLIANLVPGQHPVLRIGGDSSDRTWWPEPGMATPPWVTYTLTPTWRAVAGALARATSARLILDINLLADSPAIAGTEARELVSGIGRPRIAALEIGNEPELYSTQPWYWTARGTPVPGRPAGYDFARYVQEVARIRAALPRLPLAGPATGTLAWLSHLPALLADEPGLREVTFHRYPLSRCVTNPSSPLYPSVAHLLSSAASAGLVRGIGGYVALAHRHGVGFRVDELNAVTCGGRAGVSDTFAAALWTLDTQFWLARTGVDAVDVHIHPEAPANQLFTFRRQGGRWLGTVRPQYYGLLMFAQAAPAGAHLLRIVGPSQGRLRAWATLGPDGRIRVVLINAGLTGTSTVSVRLAGLAGVATLERLLAPSAYATRDVTLGGQRFAGETATGTLGGAMRTRTLRAIGGSYRVQVPAASAALLTIPARP